MQPLPAKWQANHIGALGGDVIQLGGAGVGVILEGNTGQGFGIELGTGQINASQSRLIQAARLQRRMKQEQ